MGIDSCVPHQASSALIPFAILSEPDLPADKTNTNCPSVFGYSSPDLNDGKTLAFGPILQSFPSRTSPKEIESLESIENKYGLV